MAEKQGMLILDAAQVRQALPMPAAVDAMREALLAISSGSGQMPLRSHLQARQPDGSVLVMPALLDGESDAACAVKIVSVFDDNPGRGLPRILATIIAIDPETGRPEALIDGTTVTAIRTAAASAAATALLARTDSDSLAIIGAGVQAREHLAAIASVRDLRVAYLSSQDRDDCEQLVRDMDAAGRTPCRVEICGSNDEAVTDADIVCTVTTSREPVFSPHAVAPGTHLNAVGSYQPGRAEIPSQTIKSARVFVDHRASALAEAGDLLMPIKDGIINADHVVGEVGEVLSGKLVGRRSRDEITVFKSVGCALEDCIATRTLLDRARELGLGRRIDLDNLSSLPPDMPG